MQTQHAQALRQLVLTAEHAALGTLHKGEPAVSMVPYALLPDGGPFVIHVSRLATHTKDMLEHAGVSLMVVAERTREVPVQALARASFAASAAHCDEESAPYAAARAAYLARFPATEPMFDFADFSLFILTPRSVRVVGGFAQAGSLTGAQYHALMSSAP
jgi:heme iron utilization protein